MIPEDFLCPECDYPLDWWDWGTIKIYGNIINWEVWRCPQCGETYSDEPDLSSESEKL